MRSTRPSGSGSARDRERRVIILDTGDLADIALVELDSNVTLGPGGGRVPIDDLRLSIDELWHLHDHMQHRHRVGLIIEEHLKLVVVQPLAFTLIKDGCDRGRFAGVDYFFIQDRAGAAAAGPDSSDAHRLVAFVGHDELGLSFFLIRFELDPCLGLVPLKPRRVGCMLAARVPAEEW